eukprot:2637267-Prymnesium_polylepis.2
MSRGGRAVAVGGRRKDHVPSCFRTPMQLAAESCALAGGRLHMIARHTRRLCTHVRLLPEALEQRLASASPPATVNHTIAVPSRDDGSPRLVNLVVLRERDGAPVTVFENYCPHAGGSLWLAPSDGATLSCKAHGAKFRPGDGLCVSGPCEGSSLSRLAVSTDAESGGLTTTIQALERLRDAGSGGRNPPAGWSPSGAVAALLEQF